MSNPIARAQPRFMSTGTVAARNSTWRAAVGAGANRLPEGWLRNCAVATCADPTRSEHCASHPPPPACCRVDPSGGHTARVDQQSIGACVAAAAAPDDAGLRGLQLLFRSPGDLNFLRSAAPRCWAVRVTARIAHPVGPQHAPDRASSAAHPPGCNPCSTPGARVTFSSSTTPLLQAGARRTQPHRHDACTPAAAGSGPVRPGGGRGR